jgi:hypothetical protein
MRRRGGLDLRWSRPKPSRERSNAAAWRSRPVVVETKTQPRAKQCGGVAVWTCGGRDQNPAASEAMRRRGDPLLDWTVRLPPPRRCARGWVWRSTFRLDRAAPTATALRSRLALAIHFSTGPCGSHRHGAALAAGFGDPLFDWTERLPPPRRCARGWLWRSTFRLDRAAPTATALRSRLTEAAI